MCITNHYNLKRPSVGSRATGTAQSPRKAVRRSTARPVARRAARRVAAGRKR